MKVQDLPRKVNADDQLVVCFDVSKGEPHGYAIHVRSGAADREIIVSIDRKADQIEEKLSELSDYADDHGLEGLCVVCEPTGGYDEELLRLARQQGHETAYVNTEHSAKMSSVESGDTNKTDPADTRAMSLVAQVDRTQTHRALEGEYGLLRELGKMYEDEDRQATRARTRFHHVLKRLFCDYEKDADFLFDSTGTAAGGRNTPGTRKRSSRTGTSGFASGSKATSSGHSGRPWRPSLSRPSGRQRCSGRVGTGRSENGV